MTTHRVLKLWYRSKEGGPLAAVDSLELLPGEGIAKDHTRGSMRHVTFVFEDDWKIAAEKVGVPDLDPVGRRANVLLSGGGGEAWLKEWIRFGDTLLEIKGVVAPCPVMDEYHQGLKDALEPPVLAGIWGRVHVGGKLEVGQMLEEGEPVPKA